MADERPRVDHQNPPFSRVFVVCSRSHTEDELRSAFQEYGEVRQLQNDDDAKMTSNLFLLKQLCTGKT